MRKSTPWICLLIAICVFPLACVSDDDEPSTPAQALLAQFGDGAAHFSEAGMQELLDFEDASSPVVLLQLMTVDDPEGFAAFEEAITTVWSNYGAGEIFASRVIGQVVGQRELMEVRAVAFPDAPRLIEALHSTEFATAADRLFAATSDHAWVLGIETNLPIELAGGFFDPTLLFLNEDDARDLLESTGNDETSLDSNLDPIIDMIVSDSPEPFYMVNLIDFYERATYDDGRDSDLTGEEANEIYGQTIGPQLFMRNSGPEILVPISVVLTAEDRTWEQAVVVRYASRDAFLNIFPLSPNAGAALDHKEAGVEETLVYVTERHHRTPPEPAAGILYDFRYCEILLPQVTDDGLIVEIWGTQGVNNCPQARWDAIEPAQIAEENGTPEVFMNGPRFFIVDWISNTEGLGSGGERRLFGELEMTRLTTVVPPESGGESGYSIARVARNNVWHFVAGRRIYELIDPDGTRYVMQSFSRIVDPNLALEDLASLGDRLELPEGWSFESRVVTETLEVPAVDGFAEVLQDDLINTYQRIP